jgi:hypothetical protein
MVEKLPPRGRTADGNGREGKCDGLDDIARSSGKAEWADPRDETIVQWRAVLPAPGNGRLRSGLRFEGGNSGRNKASPESSTGELRDRVALSLGPIVPADNYVAT